MTYFYTSYQAARSQFLSAAAALNLPVQSHAHPLKGKFGEDLAMDVLRMGADIASTPSKLLIVSSGCHGVEGYCGSGVQLAALAEAALRSRMTSAAAQGVAVLFIHALNPYGFSHIRRVTNENVDLNRNFTDFSKSLPPDAGYGEVHPALIGSQTWPPAPSDEAKLGA